MALMGLCCAGQRVLRWGGRLDCQAGGGAAVGSWACVGERRLPGVLQAKTAKWRAYRSAVKRIARTHVCTYVWECSCANTGCCVSMYVVYLCMHVYMHVCMHVCMSKV